MHEESGQDKSLIRSGNLSIKVKGTQKNYINSLQTVNIFSKF